MNLIYLCCFDKTMELLDVLDDNAIQLPFRGNKGRRRNELMLMKSQMGPA